MLEQRSRVNVKKLVTDLADMYHDETFDVVVTELAANAVDAGAREIAIDWNGEKSILVMTDDGKGMSAGEFEQYHDLATELKTRGDGIGFAGVGAKISFNIAKRVMTETWHEGIGRASDWYWGADNSLCWKPIAPGNLRANGADGMNGGSGTRVEIHFDSKLTPNNITDDYLVAVLKRHYLPLFTADFARAYEAIKLYPACPRFKVNGNLIAQTNLSASAALVKREDYEIKAGAASVGWGAVGVSARDGPIDGGRYGVLLCTHGKVIKVETFGLPTGLLGSRLYGVFEIPGLIGYLTANKSDVKGRIGGAQKLGKILNAARQVVAEFLQQQGVKIARPQPNQLSGKLERALEKIVRQLPELRDFDGLAPKSRALQRDEEGKIAAAEVKRAHHAGAYNARQDDQNNDAHGAGGGASHQRDSAGQAKAKPRRSRKNQGPRVAFEDHPERPETAWLSADTIVINSGHTAYRNRIAHAEARLTYCMFSIGVALDKADLARPADGASYVDRFVAAWGGM